MSDETGTEVSADTPIGKLKIAGRDVNTIATLVTLILVCLVSWVLWEHKRDGQESNALLNHSIKEMTLAQKEATQTQRQLNCLISIDQSKREAEYTSPNSFCNRISR